MPLRRAALAGTLAALAVLLGCTSATPSPSRPPASATVSVPSGSRASESPIGASGSPRASGPAASSEGGPVDLERPTFSDPTSITNRLFPISDLTQVIQLGDEAGEPLRVEVTLLPFTRTIEWDGQSVETQASQYIAYLDGRILEVAIDYYAQADDGAVWYFGEDVDNYEDGVVADHEGTWLAGREGPPGMITPADPRVGDVYHPENIPDLVFEEVIVLETGVTVDGPRGPVEGAIRTEEHLMDGSIEHKVFAPDYGEFQAEAPDELVTVAIATPVDRLSAELPAGLTDLQMDALAAFDAASSGDTTSVVDHVRRMVGAWQRLEGDKPPALLANQMIDALESLAGANQNGVSDEIRHAALDVVQAGLDLQLQYREPASVEVDRLGVWARRLVVDAAAGEADAVRGDVAVLETIVARVRQAVGPIGMEPVDARLEDLKAAAEGEDLDAAAEHGRALIEVFERLG